MTLFNFLIVIAVSGFLATLTLRLLPVYLNHFKVKAALASLSAQTGIAVMSREDIMTALQKRWDIDSVSDVTREQVVISREGGRIRVRVAYDVIRPVMGNVDALVHFDDSIEADPH
ncbi:MAG: DUF4845 domain-containing protein [Methylococcaceae bacterium]|jgi:hypothetical protein